MSEYVGGELELFKDARRWKSYWSSVVRPLLRGRVLEVGGGIGANTELLATPQLEWHVVEPDPVFCDQMRRNLHGVEIHCGTLGGTLESISAETVFDAVLYLDVLEHIEDDAAEIRRAAKKMRRGSKLVILAPAHSWLFSPFDSAIGHFRRYDRASLAKAVPEEFFSIHSIRYLDCLGMALSLLNRHVSKKSSPKPADILFWDRVIVPLSIPLDRLLNYSTGKSILGIWERR